MVASFGQQAGALGLRTRHRVRGSSLLWLRIADGGSAAARLWMGGLAVMVSLLLVILISSSSYLVILSSSYLWIKWYRYRYLQPWS